MKKDLSYVCDYHESLIISHLPNDLIIAEPFRHGLTNDELKKGIIAYREFLHLLFDKIAESKDKIDVASGSIYDPYGDPSTWGSACVKTCFPVFYDLTIILLSLGFHGRLETKTEMKLNIRGADMFTVIDPVTEKYQSIIKMSSERKLEMFNLLSDLGIRFNGADFSKEIDFSKSETFYITSVNNDFFVVGLKLISEAMTNNKYHIKLENLFSPIFLRGDFSPLANPIPKKYKMNINECTQGQQLEIREWIAKVNTLLTKSGCTMVHGTGCSPFTYTKRNKNITQGMACIINIGITGCFVIPGVNHLSNPNSIIALLPDDMVAMIKSGEECEKFNNEQCHRHSGNMEFARFSFIYNGKEYEGCRHAGLRCQFSGVKCRFTGFSFDLSDPNIRELTMKWIEMELEV